MKTALLQERLLPPQACDRQHVCPRRVSPQQDLRLSGPPLGQCTGGGAQTYDRGIPADLIVDSLATMPPTPPIDIQIL
ncbi:hypothetical protein PoB_003639600 [Plakobranchus ocellatus]|uniref:Uncharacterized protein n=1 Tax=Plakobranchus ocellatus TaxID=259542 RepID=A0AAV4ANZ7_9GAST|nr:hypothetical protein PoB_003639600 [Plakobranchus ocellatus]